MNIMSKAIKGFVNKTKAPELSIVIVNWNGSQILHKCLACIEQNHDNLRLEVIVVDNNSTDDSVWMVKNQYPWIKILQNSSNLGFAAATNQGLREAKSPYLLMLNNDTEILPGTLDNLLNYLKENEDVGVVGGLMVNPDGSPQLSYGFFPTVQSLLARYLLHHQTSLDCELLQELNAIQPDVSQAAMKLGCVPHQQDVPEDVDYVAGACLLTRREILHKIGYLDENFFAYFEDTDWCLRVKQGEWKVVFCPYGRVVHHVSTSFNATGQKECFFLRSLLTYTTKHFGPEAVAEVRGFLKKVFTNKKIIFTQLAGKTGNSDYQLVAEEYKKLLEVLQIDETSQKSDLASVVEIINSFTFEEFEALGYHLTPNHYYSPIPDTKALREKDFLWEKESELVGIDMNPDYQLDLLLNYFPAFQAEYSQFPQEKTDCPYEFYFNNSSFDGTDATVLHCILRHFKPNTIIEVGGGFSTFISANACLLNGGSQLITIEPFPNDVLKQGFPGLSKLVERKVEDIDFEFFMQLQDGDVLFIDSTHVSRILGDVNYIYLEILPRLNKGVIIHVHDIFFPKDYPKSWVLDLKLFWTEQYLLQAFLTFNSAFEVLFCNSYMRLKYLPELKSVFPNSPWWGGGSFWMRKKT